MLRGSQVQPREIEWLCKSTLGERFPCGMISLVASRPGQGKSSLGNFITAEATRQGHTVILSNQEDAIREVLVPRLRVAGAVMKRVLLPEDPLMLPDDLDQLGKMIRQTGAKLFIADTAAQHLRPSIYNDQEVRKALTPLRRLLQETRCACIMVAHTKKHTSSSAHPLESIGGSGGGLVGAARVVYLFGPDPKNPTSRVLVPVKSNIGPIDSGTEFSSELVPFTIKTPGRAPKTGNVIRLTTVSHHSQVTPTAMLRYAGARSGSDEDGTNPTRLAMAEEWLTGILKDGPLKTSDVEEEGKKIKLSWATILRAKKTLEIETARKGFGKDGYWQWDLPAAHPLRKAREAKEAAAAALLGGDAT